MNYKTQIVTALSLVGALAFTATPVSAAVRCETQYGGGQICVTTGNLQINKEICDPSEGSCEPSSAGFSTRLDDNLGINDHRFSPGEEVTFRLTVKNVGDANFSKVNITDQLPSMLELIPGSVKDFEITDLAPGETETRDFKTRVVSADKFESDKNLICVVNTAEAKSGDQGDKDTAQLCLEKKVSVGAPKALPPTGPESAGLALLTSAVLASAGLYLLRIGKAR